MMVQDWLSLLPSEMLLFCTCTRRAFMESLENYQYDETPEKIFPYHCNIHTKLVVPLDQKDFNTL